MATPPVPKISNGDVLRQQSHAKTASKKGNKKPFKSNITNKVKSSRAADSGIAANTESDEEVSDSSAIEENKNADEDGDVFALSNGRQRPLAAAMRRSAGPQSKDEDMIMNDDVPATAGAAQDTDDDDDQYADVEDIDESEASDDDGDINERDVRRAAESDLIGEFERSEQRREASGVTNAIQDMAIEDDEVNDIALAQELSLQDANPHVDFGLEVNMNDDPFVGLSGDDSIYKAMWDEAEMAMWRRPGSNSPKQRTSTNSGTQKRVRFEEVNDTASRASSPASSEEDAGEAFPDLFASQDDPMIQRQLALDVEDDNGLLPYDWGDLESCYDFDGDEEDVAWKVDEEEDSEESDDDSSISDSDDGGDTTDEETAEEQKAKLQERRAAVAKMKGTPVTPTPNRSVSRAASTASTPRPATPRSGPRGPQMGTFAKDPSRATITNDSVARRTKIEPPTNPPEKDKAFWENAKRANLKATRSRRGSCITVPSPGSDNIPDRPFTAQSTLGTMFNGNLDLLRNNEVSESRPPFVPPQLSNAQLSFTNTTATEDSDDDADINMQDFIEMSDSDSDDDRPVSSRVESPSESEMYSSSQNMGMPDASPGLLNHFELNRGLVGSFRRNQQSTKHFSSLASHPAKRASAHEYNALQKGRRGAANTPMTPARKKRASQDLTQVSGGVRKSMGSPLASRRPRSRGNSIASKNPAGLYDTLTQSPF